MKFNYPSEWKFPIGDGPGAISYEALSSLWEMLVRIASNKQTIIEALKSEFASTYGESCMHSSNYDFAKSDLMDIMEKSGKNAPVFLESLCNSIENLSDKGHSTPNMEYINSILDRYDVQFRIEGQSIVKLGGDAIIAKSLNSGYLPPIIAVPEIHYSIFDKPIGIGGYGTVYKATRSSSIATFDFALKFLDPSPFIENLEKASERFKREIKAIQLLQHRSIIQYIDAGIDSQKRPYLVMPLIIGKNFATSAREQSFGKRILMINEVLSGLSHAHNNGVLHRDLKPSNIIVRNTDLQPIIVDFGQAYILENMDSAALTTSGIGTAGYIPSEVLADPTIRSNQHDIYSCGIILYEIFAGMIPDPRNLSSLKNINESLECLDSVIGHALAPANLRFTNVESFQQELMDAAKNLI